MLHHVCTMFATEKEVKVSMHLFIVVSGSEDMKKRLEFLSWYTTNGEAKEELLIFHHGSMIFNASGPSNQESSLE